MFRLNMLLLIGTLFVASAPAGAEPILDFDASTPEGGWQVREMVSTNDKGEKTVSVLRQSFVGREDRGGEPHYWLEMEMSNYKIKNGERKRDGDTIIMKTLVRRSALYLDPANALQNMAGFAVEMIIQHGDSDPIRMSQGGALAQSMMQAMGIKTNYDFTEQGNETVTVPAGTFDARKISGHGATESKVVFKTLKVQSDTTSWISDPVPFGIVKAVSDDVINGKTQHTETQLLEFGKSGAVTRITKEPVDMPSLPFGK